MSNRPVTGFGSHGRLAAQKTPIPGPGVTADTERHDTRLTEFALGILDKDARMAVERELETSPEIRQELFELEESLGNFALAVRPLAPDPGLRKRLLASLESKQD